MTKEQNAQWNESTQQNTAPRSTATLCTVDIVGLGALGAMFGEMLQKALPAGAVRVLADPARIQRYRQQGVQVNGRSVDFCYAAPGTLPQADLVIFATKYGALAGAIEMARPAIGPHTSVLSLLNGIVSEEMLAAAYGPETVVYAVALGMDVVREGTDIRYAHSGLIRFGERDGADTPRTAALAALFEAAGIGHECSARMPWELWNKFLMNVGVNQACTVYETNYGGVQAAGAPREAMLAAMREVIAVAKPAGVDLSQQDITRWMQVLTGMSGAGMPSMRQDALAHRKSEVELFAGTVLQMGAQYGIDTPVNRRFYEEIRLREAAYL